MVKTSRIDSFDFPVGRIIGRKYEIVAPLGYGWESEVYLIRERSSGIERAAKFFFPQRNIKNKTALTYAKKLHKLRHCPMVIGYHTQEFIQHKGVEITVLISEYVEGEILSEFQNRQPGKRFHPFEALHFLHELADGMAAIHRLREYHGDLHSDNVIVRRQGLGFELKILDFFNWHAPKKDNIEDDVCNMIRIFYDILGGEHWYPKHPQEIKDICCGLKRSLILEKFRSAGQLKTYLETMEWRKPKIKR